MKIINRMGLNAAFAALVTAMALGLGAGQAQAGTCVTNASNNQSIFGPPNACYFVNSGPIVFNNVVYQGNNPSIFGDVLDVTINLLQFSGLRTPNPLAHIIASINDLTNPGNSFVNQDEGFESLALTLGGGLFLHPSEPGLAHTADHRAADQSASDVLHRHQS